jgi:hypothetical protein
VATRREVLSAVAEADAEGIEHHVSRETLAVFAKYLQDGILVFRVRLASGLVEGSWNKVAVLEVQCFLT